MVEAAVGVGIHTGRLFHRAIFPVVSGGDRHGERACVERHWYCVPDVCIGLGVQHQEVEEGGRNGSDNGDNRVGGDVPHWQHGGAFAGLHRYGLHLFGVHDEYFVDGDYYQKLRRYEDEAAEVYIDGDGGAGGGGYCGGVAAGGVEHGECQSHLQWGCISDEYGEVGVFLDSVVCVWDISYPDILEMDAALYDRGDAVACGCWVVLWHGGAGIEGGFFYRAGGFCDGGNIGRDDRGGGDT